MNFVSLSATQLPVITPLTNCFEDSTSHSVFCLLLVQLDSLALFFLYKMVSFVFEGSIWSWCVIRWNCTSTTRFSRALKASIVSVHENGYTSGLVPHRYESSPDFTIWILGYRNGSCGWVWDDVSQCCNFCVLHDMGCLTGKYHGGVCSLVPQWSEQSLGLPSGFIYSHEIFY